MNSIAIRLFSFFLFVFCSSSLARAETTAWDKWLNQDGRVPEESAVVQDRQIIKKGKFQFMGPSLGIQERKDFYTTYAISFGGRYHFSEKHGWEFLRVTYTNTDTGSLLGSIQAKTGYSTDVKLSHFQASTSYVYTPVYGKYAWNSRSIVHFDLYGLFGPGVRFSNSYQLFGEIGLGMNHYLFSRTIALTPEFRFRVYPEQRTTKVIVLESNFQLGLTCLF